MTDTLERGVEETSTRLLTLDALSREATLNDYYHACKKEVYPGLTLATANLKGCWTLFHETKDEPALFSPRQLLRPLLQVLPQEKRIIIYDDLYLDLAQNLSEQGKNYDEHYTLELQRLV